MVLMLFHLPGVVCPGPNLTTRAHAELAAISPATVTHGANNSRALFGTLHESLAGTRR